MWEDSPEEATESGEAPTITVGKDSLGGHECEVGDKLTFTVVAKGDGDATLRFDGYGSGEPETETEEMV